jgi:hypothetical protein
MPSFRREVKPFAHVADLQHVKEPCGDVEVGSQAKLKLAISHLISSFANRGFSHLAWHEAPLELTEETKSNAQRACIWPRCIGVT